MKRPAIIVVLLVVHVLLLTLFTAALVGTWVAAHDGQLPQSNRGMSSEMIGFWACAIIASFLAIELRGLWKMRLWSRWLGMVFFSAITIAVTIDAINERNHEVGDLLVPLICIAISTLFFLPGLRRALSESRA